MTRHWEYQLQGRTGPPQVDGDRVFVAGTIYEEGGSYGRAFELDRANGQRRWHVDDVGRGIPFTPLLTADDGLVVVDSDGTVHRIDVNGEQQQWSTDVAATPTTRPFAGQDWAYVGYDDGLRRVDLATGDVETAFEKSAGIDHATADDDDVFLTSHRTATGVTELTALEDGERVWFHRFDDTTVRGVESTSDQLIVADEHGLVAFDRDGGDVQWSTDVGMAASEPTVVDGTVYLGTEDGVAAFGRSDGEQRWSRSFDGGATTAPAVGGSYLFVGGGSVVYAVSVDDGTMVGRQQMIDGHVTTRPTPWDRGAFLGNFEQLSGGFNGRVYSLHVAPE